MRCAVLPPHVLEASAGIPMFACATVLGEP
jgi:hypothetical protein